MTMSEKCIIEVMSSGASGDDEVHLLVPLVVQVLWEAGAASPH